jgi:hypothetical protein
MLRNQGFVIVLAVIALFLVGKNLLWPAIGPKFARRTTAQATPATPAPAPAPAENRAAAGQPAAAPTKPALPIALPWNIGGGTSETPAPAVDEGPQRPMNLQEIVANFADWAANPQRDPFKMRGGINDKSAREQLTLTGILRQTESDLAVLNNRVLAVGDTILGFKVETVEADRVWVSGPNGREMLEFKYSVQAPAEAADVQAPAAVAPTPVAVVAPVGG